MPTPKKQKRNRNWLQNILGTEGAKDAEKALADLSRALDSANVRKKVIRNARRKGVMEDMQTDVAKALSKYIDEPSAELVNEVIAIAMSSMLPTSDDPLDSEELFEEETMMDEELVVDEELMMDEEEEDEEEEDKVDMYKAYRNTSIRLATVAKDVRKQNQALAGLVELFTELAQGLKSVHTDVTALKAKVNAQPRRVGQSGNGAVYDEKAQTTMKNASQKVDTFWGEPLPMKGGK